MIKNLFAAGCLISAGMFLPMSAATAANATVVELTQVNCQFLESESIDHQYQSSSAADCEKINADTGEKRLAASKVIELKAGKTVFRVTNRNVDYSLGFFLRGDGLINRAKLPKVSGGGLTRGTTKDYEIDLKPGEYVYSCPLNPTLDYKLIVKS